MAFRRKGRKGYRRWGTKRRGGFRRSSFKKRRLVSRGRTGRRGRTRRGVGPVGARRYSKNLKARNYFKQRTFAIGTPIMQTTTSLWTQFAFTIAQTPYVTELLAKYSFYRIKGLAVELRPTVKKTVANINLNALMSTAALPASEVYATTIPADEPEYVISIPLDYNIVTDTPSYNDSINVFNNKKTTIYQRHRRYFPARTFGPAEYEDYTGAAAIPVIRKPRWVPTTLGTHPVHYFGGFHIPAYDTSAGVGVFRQVFNVQLTFYAEFAYLRPTGFSMTVNEKSHVTPIRVDYCASSQFKAALSRERLKFAKQIEEEVDHEEKCPISPLSGLSVIDEEEYSDTEQKKESLLKRKKIERSLTNVGLTSPMKRLPQMDDQ